MRILQKKVMELLQEFTTQMVHLDWWEGTRTWPDYLVNRVLTKNEGQYLKKIVRKSRNSCSKNSGGVGEH